MTDSQRRLWAIADAAEILSVRMDELSKKLRSQVKREDARLLNARKMVRGATVVTRKRAGDGQ